MNPSKNPQQNFTKRNLTIYKTEDHERWCGSKMWRSPPSPQIQKKKKKIAACETAPTEHLLNADRRPHTFKKAS